MSKKNTDKKPAPASPKASFTMENPAKNRNRTIILLIFLVSFLLYGNTIPNEFAMDDELVTLDHPNVSKGFSGIPKILTSRYVQNAQQSYEYRPIVLVTFAIEHQFTSGNPHFSHFINILLYALTGVVLFFLLSRLFIEFHWILPVAVTFLFLLHPIHSEVVASLKNRDELLSFLFTLFSIGAFLNYIDRKHWKYILFGMLFFILAMLSKKSALPLIFTLPLTLYFFKGLQLKKALLFVALPVLFLVLFKLIMSIGFEPVHRPGLYFENPYYVEKPGFFTKLPMAFYSMGYYLKLLILPYPLLVYYGYSHVEIATWGNPLTLISVVIFIGATIYCLMKLKEKSILVFGILYFILNIGAFSNIVPMPGLIAERFAYGASLGFSIVVVYALFKLLKIDFDKNSKSLVPANLKYIGFALALVSVVYVFNRNRDWENHLSIYKADILKAPNSAKIHALIGGHCTQQLENDRKLSDPNMAAQLPESQRKPLTPEEKRDRILTAKKHFKAALEVYPEYAACWNNLGTLYFSYIGEVDSAAMYFKKVVELDPGHTRAHFNLGNYYEIYFSSLVLMENYYNSKAKTDSTSSAVPDKKKYEKFISEVRPIFRTATVSYSDITGIVQRFINDSRNNPNLNRQNYINALDGYWTTLMNKMKADPTKSLNPGAAIINYVVTSTTSDASVFNAGLRIVIQNYFDQQFAYQTDEIFVSHFKRSPDSSDFYYAAHFTANLKKETLKNMIAEFHLSLFSKDAYTPAYGKLSQLYTQEKLWDSLINLNERIKENKEVVRHVDLHRSIANAWYQKKNIDKCIEFLLISNEEEEMILRKTTLSLNIQSKAGNNVAVQKLSQLYNSVRQNLANGYRFLAAVYREKGDVKNAEIYEGKLQALG